MERLRLYDNGDGTVGIRRHVLVLALNAFCATTARLIGQMVAGTTVLVHPHGRNEIGEPRERLDRSTLGVALNGNVHSLLVVGYERKVTDAFVEQVRSATSKPVEVVVLQECGGSWPAALAGARKAVALVEKAAEATRVDAGWKDLRIGVKCGGSDGSSILGANPVVGDCVDWLVDQGATVIFSETTEIIGAEHLLVKRARSPEVGRKIVEAAEANLAAAKRAGVDLLGTNPVPDNIAGGITTIEEKALGAIRKAGTRTIEQVVGFGQVPTASGLVFMDGPSGAHEALSAFAAAGCHLALFATGTCNPVGNLVMPVVKVCGNREWVERMADHVDVDVSEVIEDAVPTEQAMEKLRARLVRVIHGLPTRSEILRHTEMVMIPTGL